MLHAATVPLAYTMQPQGIKPHHRAQACPFPNGYHCRAHQRSYAVSSFSTGLPGWQGCKAKQPARRRLTRFASCWAGHTTFSQQREPLASLPLGGTKTSGLLQLKQCVGSLKGSAEESLGRTSYSTPVIYRHTAGQHSECQLHLQNAPETASSFYKSQGYWLTQPSALIA